eukprot:TRINITY_DN29990_c0_g1_i1.p1 TRINITY_DN29990_c0_g1~~TRINITY_DN29990_c0_g1_i1.p1  ORF type:complete len:314 (+),score=73.29 TRINITY_DN29990_c0_g1_i1:106-1047(+)
MCIRDRNEGACQWAIQRNEQGIEVIGGWAQYRSSQRGISAGDLLKVYEDSTGAFTVALERVEQPLGNNGICGGLPKVGVMHNGDQNGSVLGLATTKDALVINRAMLTLAELVFLGDSIVAGIPPQLQRHHFQNFGISGSCVEDVLSLVRSPKFVCDCAAQVKVLVLCIGTNNLWKDPVDVVVQSMMQSVRQLCSTFTQTRLVVLGLLPRGDSDFDKTAKQIASFNRQIRYACRESLGPLAERVSFVDIGTKFLDRGGNLIGDLYLMDKLHLSSDGYCVFMGEIAPTVDQLLVKCKQQSLETCLLYTSPSPRDS